jgi:hypothetical protein
MGHQINVPYKNFELSSLSCFTAATDTVQKFPPPPAPGFENLFVYIRTRDSDWLRAGWPTGRRLSPGKGKNFLFSTSFRPVLGPTQPHIQWVPGVLLQRVKRQEREADHSPPTSAEVKNM